MNNDNSLKKIHDEATILTLLGSAKEAQHEVFIWRLIGGSKHLAGVRVEAIRRTRNDFCISPISGQNQQVQDMMGTLDYIDLYIPDSALLLRCKIRQTDAPTRYYLEIPSFVAQVERRKSMRLNVHTTDEIKVTFAKATSVPRLMTQHFNKSCFDISSGGFSFLVSRMESKYFKINDPIRMINLQTSEWASSLNAEIALIKEIEPDEYNGLTYKVWRVCCRFSQMDDLTKKRLEKYIFERIKDELHVING